MAIFNSSVKLPEGSRGYFQFIPVLSCFIQAVLVPFHQLQKSQSRWPIRSTALQGGTSGPKKTLGDQQKSISLLKIEGFLRWMDLIELYIYIYNIKYTIGIIYTIKKLYHKIAWKYSTPPFYGPKYVHLSPTRPCFLGGCLIWMGEGTGDCSKPSQ